MENPPAEGHPHKLRYLVLCAMATFMSALDGSVVNIALPVIRGDYHASVGAMDWVVSAYLLSICALLLAVGKLGDVMGYVRLMGAGLAVFGAASVFCGASTGVIMLSIARAVQGIGAAMLMASGPALIAAAYPPKDRGKALGAIATATYLGLALGPSLGGFIVSWLGWRWVFWVNLPFSIAGTLWASRLKSPNEQRAALKFDAPGAVLWAALLVTAMAAIANAEASSLMRGGLAGAAVVLVALFIVRERRAAHPLLPLDLFKDAAFSGGVAAAWLQYGALFVLSFQLPFLLEEVKGIPPAAAGLIMTAQPVVMVFTTGPAGWLSDRVGPRLPATVGLVVLAFGEFFLGLRGVAGGRVDALIGLAIVGLGVGLFTTPNNSAILSSAPPSHRGVASGLLAAARNVGMVCGVSAAGALIGHAAAPEALGAAFHRGMFFCGAVACFAALLSALRPTRAPQPR